MPIEPNERLIAEAAQIRLAWEHIPKPERKIRGTTKEISELSAVLAIIISEARGEQPELTATERLEGRTIVAELADKVIPPNMKGMGEEL